MASPRVERRLAAILAADVVGYSRLMERDEHDTHARVKALHAEVFAPLLAEHGGRIVKLTGDGVLCEFASVVAAVACAMGVQARVGEREGDVAEDRRIRFRIGVNLGDIISDPDGDIYGDGVNIAARLEGLSAPGGVLVSSAAYDQLQGKLAFAFDDLGEQALKNIARPVRVYRVRADGAAPGRALSMPDRPSIAVLPFDDMSGDADKSFFADGISEDVITALCKFSGFFVIARNTMFTYKGRAVDVRALGRDLGVRYVLEGSVRKAGERVRVTAQLIEATTGNHLWADRYDGRLEDIFAIQDEITESVVGRIGPELMVAEHSRAARKAPHSLDAWECVVRALGLSAEQSQEGSAEAIALIDRALADDPNYAQALGLKAWILVFRAFQGWEDMGHALGQAGALIARGLTADADEAWPYLAQGMVGFATRDNALSMRALTRAAALNPNLVNVHGLLAVAHAFGGRPDEAVACVDRAVRLSPRDTFLSDFQLYYAFAHFQAARYAQALTHARQAHQMRPGHPYPLLLGAACAGHLGQTDIAAALLAELRTIVPTVSAAWVEMTSPYVLAEDRGRLIAGLGKAGLG